jgi:Protein of unknown function (DUF3551)
MRGILLAVLVFGSISAGGSGSAAATEYPYCAASGDDNRCDFTSYEQCMATVTGIGQECIVNPIIAFRQGQQLQQPEQPSRRRPVRRLSH